MPKPLPNMPPLPGGGGVAALPLPSGTHVALGRLIRSIYTDGLLIARVAVEAKTSSASPATRSANRQMKSRNRQIPKPWW